MSFKIVPNTLNIDEISFNITEFNLGEKLVVSVNFFYQQMLQKNSSYTFMYSNTVPARYNHSSTTFTFPYYLPNDVTSTIPTLSSFSSTTFDIYIINGLILPSIKYYEKLFSTVNDLTLVSNPTFTTTSNGTSIKVDYTFPTTNTFFSKNYLYINSNSYSIDGPTGSIIYGPTNSNTSYNIYTSSSNPYTGISGPSSSYTVQ
jgi:hypothetical protein